MIPEPKHLKGNYYLQGELLLVRSEATDKGQYFRGAEISEYEVLGIPVPEYVRRKTKVK